MFTNYIYGQGDFQTRDITYILCMGIAFMMLSMVLYTVHVTCQDIDGGATEADGGASAPVGPSVATPLIITEATRCFRVLRVLHYIVNFEIIASDK